MVLRTLKTLQSWFAVLKSACRKQGCISVKEQFDIASNGRSCYCYTNSEEDTSLHPNQDSLKIIEHQWKIGAWTLLSELDRDCGWGCSGPFWMEMLAAMSKLQNGDVVGARGVVARAMQRGCSRSEAAKGVIAGLYNTLGRIAALSDLDKDALRCFDASLRLGPAKNYSKGTEFVRAHEQYLQLGLSQENLSNLEATRINGRNKKASLFEVRRISRTHIGDYWAGNTINTVIFRYHAILTCQGRQYVALYVNSRTLRIVERDLSSGRVRSKDILGDYSLYDAHNSVSLGVDRKGFIHICYDHHSSRLRYRRSEAPFDISEWTSEMPMTGELEERVTYPTFILPRGDSPLMFLYRNGVHDKGDAFLKIYDENEATWKNLPTAILSGAHNKPWSSNAYWNHPATGSDGSLHLSFVWRTHPVGEDELINNIGIGYACSQDNGESWNTSRLKPYKLPITQVNGEIIYAISPASNLINQCGMALDSHNYPHIVFYSDDLQSIVQYRHLWFDGKEWRHQVISNRKKPFDICGKGTLRIPISRPEIIIDDDDNVFVIMRADFTKNRFSALLLAAPDYKYDEKNMFLLVEDDVGFAEPIIDHERWLKERVLTLLVHYNDQPDHDLVDRELFTPAHLSDFKFTVF